MQPIALDQASGLRALRRGAPVRTVCVSGALAGCGRTTLAVNLALALAQKGRRVLLIDCCTNQPGAAQLFGARSGADPRDLVRTEATGQMALIPCRDRLSLLRLGGTLRSLQRGCGKSAAWLGQVLDSARESADLVVLDADPAVLAPAVAAQDLIVVTGADPATLTGTYRGLKQLAAQTARQRTFVLVNRARSEEHAARVFGNLARTAGQFLGMPVDWLGWLPDDDRMRRAALSGRPVLECFPGAAIAGAIDECARIVHGWPSGKETTLQPFAQRLANAARIPSEYA